MRIPEYDISMKTQWQTVVDREKGVYIGHPTTVLLDDGKTVVCVYPKSHGFGPITLKKSFDGGKTWTDRLPVPESFLTSLEVPTIHKVTDKNGVRRLVLFSGLYPIRMSVSEDEGDTWSELKPIGNFGGIVSMGDVVCTGPGEYLALFHDDGRCIRGGSYEKTEVYATGSGTDTRTKYVHYFSQDGGKTWSEPQDHWLKAKEREGDQWRLIHTSYLDKVSDPINFRVYQTRSVDGGLTWSDAELITDCPPDLHLCEPGMLYSQDRTRLVALLRENTHKQPSCLIESVDNGKTWSAPRALPWELTGDRHCLRYLPDGRVFASFRDTSHGSLTYGDWVAWVGTFEDIVEGRPGQYRLRIMRNYRGADCAYPAIEILPDGTVVTTTYGHFENCPDPTDTEDAYVVSVRFTIEQAEREAVPLDLMLKALEMRNRSYAPYSHFTVGAALLTRDGKVYTGCNIENGTFTPTICAERTAFFKAVSEGDREFECIAIAGGPEGQPANRICAPCGVCRQVMQEFCGPDFRIYLGNNTDNITVCTLKEMLPYGFLLSEQRENAQDQ